MGMIMGAGVGAGVATRKRARAALLLWLRLTGLAGAAGLAWGVAMAAEPVRHVRAVSTPSSAASVAASPGMAAPSASSASSSASPTFGASIPYQSEDSALAPSVERVLGALVVCAVAGAVLFRLRRQGRLPGLRAPRARTLDILETLALDGKARLYVVRHGQAQLLIARSEHGVTLLRQGTVSPTSPTPPASQAEEGRS